jgi:hypothetical protein
MISMMYLVCSYLLSPSFKNVLHQQQLGLGYKTGSVAKNRNHFNDFIRWGEIKDLRSPGVIFLS